MIAFFVGVVAFIICAVVTSERKYLIPAKDKDLSDAKSKKLSTAKAKDKKTVAEAKPEPEFKNSTGLNILLYVGCFLVIAALTGYVSTVDEALVPPIVLTITSLALMASILIFKFVKFLKPSSYAFNVSALIMFLFWIPSLTALGLDEGYAFLASFFFLTGASIISASIFKHKALWYVPAFSIIGLIISCLGVLGEELSIDTILLVYGSVIIFMTLSIAFRFFWKAKVTWLPVQTRHATRTFSFIYPFFAAFFTLAALDSPEDYPFTLTIFATLLTFYFLLDHILLKSKSLVNILRVCLEVICVAIAIDVCLGLLPDASDLTHRNIILATILVSSFIQSLISIIIFAAKHDEESHAHERFVFAAALVGFAICLMFSDITSSYSSYTPDRDMFGDIILIGAELSTIAFSILAILLDRNPLMLIITALGLCSIATVNLDSSELIACAILSAAAVIFSASYGALKKIHEKHSLTASLSSAIICGVIALFLGSSESIAYIPILAIGLSIAIQGFLLDKKALRITGIYVVALGIVAAWSSVRSEFAVMPHNGRYAYVYSYPIGIYITDILMCLVPPAAGFLLSLFDTPKPKTLKDGTTTSGYGVNFIVGFALTVLNTIFIIPEISGKVSFFAFTLSLAILIGLLIWSLAKKWIGFEVASLCAILVLVLESVDDNIWLTLIVAGIGIISIVVFVSYKNYKKLSNGQPTAQVATTATTEPKPEEPQPEEKKADSESKPKAQDKDSN